MSRSTSTVRVKVSTEQLLAAVRLRRAKIVESHERDAKAFDGKSAVYRKKVLDALRSAVDKIEAGGDLPATHRYEGDLVVRCRAKAPSEPTLDTSSIDRLIATLEMSTDDSIPMTADDAASYLG